MKKIFMLIAALVIMAGAVNAKTDSTKRTIAVSSWLTAGPIGVRMPAFHDQNSVRGKKFKTADLLKLQTKKVNNPVKGEMFLMRNGKKIVWKEAKVSKSGYVNLKPLKNYSMAQAWLASWIYVDRFVKIKVETETRRCFELYVDGRKKISKYNVTGEKKEADKKSCNLTLERGTHLIVIKTLYNSEKKGTRKIVTRLTFPKALTNENIKTGTNPEFFMDIDHLLNGKHLTGASLSYSSKLIMLRYNKVFAPGGKSESWFEIRDRKTNTLVYSSQYAQISNVQWVPGKEAVSFKAKTADGNKLFMLDITTMTKTLLMDNLKETGYYRWSPAGDFIIYSVNEKPKKDKDGVIRVVNPMDRWPWWRNRGQLFKLNIADLSTERLTYGYLNSDIQDISKDGKKLLFSQSIPNFNERPYTKQIMMELDLQTHKVDTLWVQNFGGNAQYSPDGHKLLVTGSAQMFNGAGINIPKKMIPNDYDIQACIYDIKSNTATCITKNFNPSVQSAHWLSQDDNIYFKVEDKTWNKLYRYDVTSKSFTGLNAKVDMVSDFDIALQAPFMIYRGSSMQYPATAWICNIDGSNHQKVDDPEKEFFDNITFGKTENFNFKNKEGRTIEGRVYYPPKFESSKKYPVIVYYYGGTSPTGRSFRGRYPKNLMAAEGYIVYVLQPGGATGFGQEFSALHVNNWGNTVADEIILGTQTFLKQHPAADARKVGCMGASYGGFMTMLLTTRTNLFAAAVEHAGISSIASYWGEGYWGYLYSSVASANSFPWNNKQLYVEQSPLFHADKINTPLLLLHGKADTNVPVGESIQMFTALKLLGKPVELVEIEGQDHHITDYKKRILWQKTIFAWFDKWLKEQPDWWNNLYPKEEL